MLMTRQFLLKRKSRPLYIISNPWRLDCSRNNYQTYVMLHLKPLAGTITQLCTPDWGGGPNYEFTCDCASILI